MSVQDRLAVSSDTSAEHAFATIAALEAEVGTVIVGQQLLIRRLLTGLFAAIPFATARAQARAVADIVRGERRLVGWRTSTEYRDLYRAGLTVAAAAGAALWLLL